MNLSQPFAKYPLNAAQSDQNSPFHHLVEHMFISTQGFAILLDRWSPLWFRVEPNSGDPLMCISVEAKAPYDTTATDFDESYIIFSVYAGMCFNTKIKAGLF